MSDLKDRRKALGWSRQQLAEKAALDKRVVQLAELGQWSESDALARLDYVLKSAEHGDLDVQLDPIQAPEGAPAIGQEQG